MSTLVARFLPVTVSFGTSILIALSYPTLFNNNFFGGNLDGSLANFGRPSSNGSDVYMNCLFLQKLDIESVVTILGLLVILVFLLKDYEKFWTKNFVHANLAIVGLGMVAGAGLYHVAHRFAHKCIVDYFYLYGIHFDIADVLIWLGLCLFVLARFKTVTSGVTDLSGPDKYLL